jgi:hypothetical protein
MIESQPDFAGRRQRQRSPRFNALPPRSHVTAGFGSADSPSVRASPRYARAISGCESLIEVLTIRDVRDIRSLLFEQAAQALEVGRVSDEARTHAGRDQLCRTDRRRRPMSGRLGQLAHAANARKLRRPVISRTSPARRRSPSSAVAVCGTK